MPPTKTLPHPSDREAVHAIVLRAKTGDLQAVADLCDVFAATIRCAVANALKAHVQATPFRDDLAADAWQLMARMCCTWRPDGGRVVSLLFVYVAQVGND